MKLRLTDYNDNTYMDTDGSWLMRRPETARL